MHSFDINTKILFLTYIVSKMGTPRSFKKTKKIVSPVALTNQNYYELLKFMQ